MAVEATVEVKAVGVMAVVMAVVARVAVARVVAERVVTTGEAAKEVAVRAAAATEVEARAEGAQMAAMPVVRVVVGMAVVWAAVPEIEAREEVVRAAYNSMSTCIVVSAGSGRTAQGPKCETGTARAHELGLS